MKRDAGVKAVFLLKKKTAFTPASLFIFGRRTDVTLLTTYIQEHIVFKKVKCDIWLDDYIKSEN